MDLEKELKEKNAEIEELRKRLDEAQDANRAKEVFMSNMSHDIRTPMNAIIGMTALARKYIDEKPRVQDALDKIETASSHLMNLLNDVLDMSRINSGKLRIASEQFALSDLIHDVMVIIQPQMGQRGHRWKLNFKDIEVEQFSGDALRLKQIYVNIISNSIKYTNAGGEIEMEFSQRREAEVCHLVFRCKDNGIGMSREFLQRIFVPFERVNNSTVSKIEGTGLGMSIVKSIVDAMGGTIEIQSEPGKGTDVVVDIPLEVVVVKVEVPTLKGMRVLVIESDPVLCERYSTYFNEAGIDFCIVPSASLALSALTEADFEGKGIGMTVIGKSRNDNDDVLCIAQYLHKAKPDMSMVLVSDADWEEMEYRATRSGIDSFIPVPFFRKSLLNGLEKAAKSEVETDGHLLPDLRGKRILLVEDNMVNQMIALEILGTTKAEISTAEDGQQAVKMFNESESGYYDLIFMDIQMPVMDGYEATRAIRAMDRPDAKRIPIYAMTANTFAEDVARATNAGMNGHIAKPIDINNVMNVLNRHLRV